MLVIVLSNMNKIKSDQSDVMQYQIPIIYVGKPSYGIKDHFVLEMTIRVLEFISELERCVFQDWNLCAYLTIDHYSVSSKLLKGRG